MADLAKSTHQVVSTGPPSPPALTPSPPRSDSSDSYVDLSFNMPDTDGTSLQDLIDSELAMRVSTETIDEDDRVEEEVAAATPVKRLDLIDLVVRTNGHASPTTDASARFIAAERGLVPSPPLKSPEELTEADILFYNTFNQAQSNGDESPSSPEIVTSDGSKEFDPFATIPPAELESPTFPPAELESPTFPPAELESPTFPPDTTSSPEEESPTLPPDTNPVVDSSPESPTNSSRVANRMDVCTNIPHIGVTPPDPGTEYDEDDYYSKLEARNDLVSQEVETTDLIGQEVETTDLIGQLVESTDLIGQEVESTDLIGQLVESTDFIGQEVETTDLIGQPVESSDIICQEAESTDLIVQEAESSDLISKEVEGSDLISQEIERSDVIGQLVESSHLIGQEAESSDLIYRQETESTDLISQEVERSDVIGQEVEVSDLISQEADSTDLIGQLLESSDVIGGDDLDVSLSESEPAEQKEDFDSWTKVSEVDFDRSEGSQVVDLSQASDIVEHVVDVCINSPGSDTESSEAITTSSSTDKKTTKKKKSETGDATTTKVKRNKKNKKEEKENISVVPDALLAAPTAPAASSPTSSAEVLLGDAPDLLNVSVKELTQSYCSEATRGFDRAAEAQQPRETYATGVSIRELRRSFGDLTNLVDKDELDQRDNMVEESGECMIQPEESDGPVLGAMKVTHAPCQIGSPLGTAVTWATSYCTLVEQSNTKPLLVSKPRTVYTPPPPHQDKPEKSSFSKFDAMSKKTVLHVRSGDASKAQKQFSQASSGEVSSNCKACDKQVFQMEAVKAERCVWHKNCFRCKECNKQLTVDMYSSHEGVLYCKPHFKDLFKPKAVIEDDTPMPRRRKAGPIISENQPAELPPEVVRASDKPDLGLEELSQLNVKSRFQAFEQKNEEENAIDRSPSAVNVKRSPSILSKLARFQAKGMDIGVTDDSLNGIPLGDASSSEEEEEDEEEGEGDREVVRANRKQRERPVSFSKMEDMKGRWESGTSHKREERREERKQEISTIRSRLFMGHQGKMKEAYQQAVTESAAAGAPREKKEGVEVGGTQARSIKERFERGEVTRDEDDIKKAVDEDLVDAGYSKKSRSLFLEMDASAGKTSPLSPARNESFKRPREAAPLVRQPSEGGMVRASDAVQDVQIETADVGNKFKFFETFKPAEREKRTFRITPPREGTVKGKSPEREIYRDPLIARADDKVEEQEVHRSQTASRMLSFFKHMEESATKEDLPAGPKPLKRFTPPPDCELNRESGSSDEESEEEEEDEEDEEEETNPNIIRASDKIEDEFLKQAQTEAVRAKSLRAKFERWEEREVERERAEEQTQEQGDQSSLDTTKSLRARFESMNSDLQLKDKVARPKVNRFVDIQTSCAEFCATCEKKVYHLEKVETGGKIFHKNCFRCLQCNCVLRMDTYTLNSGKLYCIPHFKQIFFAKGNYEEGFGIDQHKRKWASAKSNDILLTLSAQEH